LVFDNSLAPNMAAEQPKVKNVKTGCVIEFSCGLITSGIKGFGAK